MNSNVFSLIQFLLWAVNCCNRCLQFFTVGCQLTQIDLCNGRITHTHTHTHPFSGPLSGTDNHASTSPLSFLQAGCPSCCPTNSVKALKAQWSYNSCGYYCLVMHILFPTILACLHHTTLKALLELIWDIAFVGLTVCMVESVIGTVCTVCGAGFMKQYGVRPPVCLSPIHPLQQHAVGFAAVGPVGDINQLLHGWRHSSTGPQHTKQQQMRAVPRFTVRCCASAVLAMGLSVCLSVCPSQVGVLSKRLNESSWFLACELPSTHSTLC